MRVLTRGERIRLRRLDLGLNGTELGRRVGVTQQMISKLENDQVDQSKYMLQLIEALQVPPHWFSIPGDEEELLEIARRNTPVHTREIQTLSSLYMELDDEGRAKVRRWMSDEATLSRLRRGEIKRPDSEGYDAWERRMEELRRQEPEPDPHAESDP